MWAVPPSEGEPDSPSTSRSSTVHPEGCAHVIFAVWVEAGRAPADGHVVYEVPLGLAVLAGISRGDRHAYYPDRCEGRERHPYYRRTQINTEMIAAEQILCN